MTPEQRLGLAAALTSYVIWGLFPLYFQLITHVSPFEVLLHRILWATPLLAVLLTFRKSWGNVAGILADKRVLGALCVSSLLICGNWLLYNWMVMNGAILEASLGYFINPLMTVALAVVFLKERMRPAQMAALGFAGLGVLNQIIFVGMVPLAALGLAVTFATYALVRKVTPVGPMSGLFMEVALVFLPFLALFVWLSNAGEAQFFESPSTTLLLIMCGPLTVLPLFLFSFGARRLRLTTIGLSQYIGPTLQFIIALSLGEPFSWAQGVTFLFIWAGLAVFTVEAWRYERRTAAPV